jgi:hypothetical protein
VCVRARACASAWVRACDKVNGVSNMSDARGAILYSRRHRRALCFRSFSFFAGTDLASFVPRRTVVVVSVTRLLQRSAHPHRIVLRRTTSSRNEGSTSATLSSVLAFSMARSRRSSGRQPSLLRCLSDIAEDRAASRSCVDGLQMFCLYVRAIKINEINPPLAITCCCCNTSPGTVPSNESLVLLLVLYRVMNHLYFSWYCTE